MVPQTLGPPEGLEEMEMHVLVDEECSVATEEHEECSVS